MFYWAVASLALIVALVLMFPFSVNRAEEELEIFLSIMGCAAKLGIKSRHRGRAAMPAGMTYC